MDKSVNNKYKSQVAEKEYKESVEQYNHVIDELETKFYPVLNIIQQNEEFRIKITKNYFAKFLKHVQTFGKKLSVICEENHNKMGALA